MQLLITERFCLNCTEYVCVNLFKYSTFTLQVTKRLLHMFNFFIHHVPLLLFLCIHRTPLSQPQCVPITTSTCAAVFPQSYYIPVAGREESETFGIVTEISGQFDLVCRNALRIYACYFIHPPCDPDTGIDIYLYAI